MAKNHTPKTLGRYKLVREIGRGAMGVVYEGIDPVIGRRVAIKAARRDLLEGEERADEMMERFIREAHAAGQLNHPGIITIYDADQEKDIAFIAMEYMAGGSLKDRIQKRGRLEEKEAVKISIAICNALAAAHDKGVVHRDVKPANILMHTDGGIKVADFGIARLSDSTLTQDGAIVGTPYCMSPEQVMGQKVDGRSDLFSVGVILYEMLTGERPFTGDAFGAILHKIVNDEPIPPHLVGRVNENLSRVIMKALSKTPEGRYQDGRHMAAALRESLKSSPNPAILGVDDDSPPPPPIQRQDASTVLSMYSPERRGAVEFGDPYSGEPEDMSSFTPRMERLAPKRTLLPAILTTIFLLIVGVVAAYFVLSGRRAPSSPAPSETSALPQNTKPAPPSAPAPEPPAKSTASPVKETPSSPPAKSEKETQPKKSESASKKKEQTQEQPASKEPPKETPAPESPKEPPAPTPEPPKEPPAPTPEPPKEPPAPAPEPPKEPPAPVPEPPKEPPAPVPAPEPPKEVPTPAPAPEPPKEPPAAPTQETPKETQPQAPAAPPEPPAPPVQETPKEAPAPPPETPAAPPSQTPPAAVETQPAVPAPTSAEETRQLEELQTESASIARADQMQSALAELPSVGHLNATIWFADTQEAWNAANNTKLSKGERYTLCATSGTVTAVIRDAVTPSEPVIDTQVLISGGVVNIKTMCPQIRVTYEREGYVPVDRVYSSDSPGQLVTDDVVMKSLSCK
jgi:serine/threonine protein kinase